MVYTTVYFSKGEELVTLEGYTYSSSDEEVATVVDGVITAIANGNATITVTGKKSGLVKLVSIQVE